MLRLKRATEEDLEFLIRLDLDDEGYTPGDQEPRDPDQHRAKIGRFVRDPDKAAWVCGETATGRLVAGILCSFRALAAESPSAGGWAFYHSIRQFLPADGRFCEVFNLWVDPGFRRQGLATRLKEQLEIESRRRGVTMIYTHTEAGNPHVIELNRKLGYRQIRRGPIWDAVERVSLVKDLT